ncbi:PrgI family protein [bacterium]|nr:PrgI family protein [bacterium]
MEFTVPKFIEHESKVIWFLSFRQFLILAAAGLICLAAFYKTPFWLFLIISTFVGGGAVFITFFKIHGRPPLVILKDFLLFMISPKVYMWKRKITPVRIVAKTTPPVSSEEIFPPHYQQYPQQKKIKKSKLRSLSIKVETTK